MGYGRRNSYEGGGYGGRRQFNFGGPKPVEMGKEYDVQVTERSDRGDGIAKIQGFVIFVKNGKVGDKIKVKPKPKQQSTSILKTSYLSNTVGILS
jgi:predicted RNA-binding protein with TRAM domain